MVITDHNPSISDNQAAYTEPLDPPPKCHGMYMLMSSGSIRNYDQDMK